MILIAIPMNVTLQNAPARASAGEASAKLIAAWKAVTLETIARQNAKWGYPPPDENTIALIQGQADEAAKHLDSLWRDNSHKSASELQELAQHLSPIGTGLDDAGMLARLVMCHPVYAICADPRLLTALVWWNWGMGRVGFQFLSDPATLPLDDYRDEARGLVELFGNATEGDPSRILTGDDLAFYNSLPDRFTVWRGCSGISAEAAGAGLCWTTRREIAVWFAHRSQNAPVLMRARIRKSEVLLASATEYEVVTAPKRLRTVPFLKGEPGAKPENMAWSAGDAA